MDLCKFQIETPEKRFSIFCLSSYPKPSHLRQGPRTQSFSGRPSCWDGPVTVSKAVTHLRGWDQLLHRVAPLRPDHSAEPCGEAAQMVRAESDRAGLCQSLTPRFPFSACCADVLVIPMWLPPCRVPGSPRMSRRLHLSDGHLSGRRRFAAPEIAALPDSSLTAAV